MSSQDVESVVRSCRAGGLAMTVQRRAVLEALSVRHDHPTADQIYEAVRGRVPGISRTTVYRVLETFLRIGVARRVSQPGAAVRFEARTDGHHHLVCRRCGRIDDVDLPGLRPPPHPRTGFQIIDWQVEFSGYCPHCRPKEVRR
jgi:Fur family transcriptional regulator, peroxide stress response regulator